MDDEGLKSAVVGELLFIGLAVVAGLMEAWGLFSVLALGCILVPLWIVAVSAIVLVSAATSQGEQAND